MKRHIGLNEGKVKGSKGIFLPLESSMILSGIGGSRPPGHEIEGGEMALGSPRAQPKGVRAGEPEHKALPNSYRFGFGVYFTEPWCAVPRFHDLQRASERLPLNEIQQF